MKARTLVLILAGLVGLAVLAIVLGGFLFAGWFTLGPASGEAAAMQESAVITKQHVNERLGYSLHFPQAYSVEARENGDSFVIGSSMNHSDPRLSITVSDAEGATANSVADALVGSLEGFHLERYTWVIDGREAQVVDGVPGQELSRVVFLVEEGRLYQLTFTHADESLGETYSQMEELFLIVAGSFRLNR